MVKAVSLKPCQHSRNDSARLIDMALEDFYALQSYEFSHLFFGTHLGHKGEQTRQALDVAQDRITELGRRNEDLLKQMEAVRTDAAQGLSQAEDLAALTRMQEDSQKAIERLKQENEALRSGKAQAGGSQQVEGELRLTLEEIARLQNLLAEANMRAAELEMGSTTARPGEQAEVVASISQELRQPMSSLVG